MTDAFTKAIAFTLLSEGGFSDDTHDPGGKTMYGVTQPPYNEYRLLKGKPPQSVTHITKDEATDLYRLLYWQRSGCDHMPGKLACAVFDWAVNSGVGSAVKDLQQCLGVTADGSVGPITFDAIETTLSIRGEDALIEDYLNKRLLDYKHDRNYAHFGQGWENRVKNLRAYLAQLTPSSTTSSLKLSVAINTTNKVETNNHKTSIPMTTIADYRDCDTAGLRALDLQLIAEIKRLQPGVLSTFDNEMIVLGGGAHDSLQPPAVKALHRAVQKRGVTLHVNSAYRTIAQQFVLRNQLEHGRCGRTLVADVGKSNHNGGMGIDIQDHVGWRRYLEAEEWDWLGSRDDVHFDYRGGGTIDIRPLSVRAFQSLWNLNHPEDKITEDGAYGPGTKQRLLKTPVSGFAKTHVPDAGKPANATLAQDKPSDNSDDTISLKFGTMREGATGEQVKRLQYALNAQGFTVTVDSQFGASTAQAVKEFQKKEGIAADGVAGTMTLEALGLLKRA